MPVPVCPYANTVQLNPSSVSATMGSIACAYTSACVASGPNTPSNVYVLDAACAAPVVAPGFPPETALACEDAPGPLAGSGVATTISRRDGFAVTATAALEARSAAFRGLRVGRGRAGSGGARSVSLGRFAMPRSEKREAPSARKPSDAHRHRTTTLTFASSAGRRGAALAGRLIAPAACADARASVCTFP